MSGFLWPHRLLPTRLLCPWNSPGKSSGVGSHFLFQGIFLTQGLNRGVSHCRQIPYHLSHQVQSLQNKLWGQKLIKWNLPSSKEKVSLTLKSSVTQKKSETTQLCPTLCDPMGCSLPGSSVHGILQARILEWIAISSSRGSSWPRDWTWVSRTAGRLFTIWATREARYHTNAVSNHL